MLGPDLVRITVILQIFWKYPTLSELKVLGRTAKNEVRNIVGSTVGLTKNLVSSPQHPTTTTTTKNADVRSWLHFYLIICFIELSWIRPIFAKGRLCSKTENLALLVLSIQQWGQNLSHDVWHRVVCSCPILFF